MKERPILFSGPMVRALLDGSKTQTRRIADRVSGFGKVRQFQASNTPGYDFTFRCKRGLWQDFRKSELLARCPFGNVGDRLWVRETWAVVPHVTDDGPKHRAKCDGTGATWRADWNENPSGFIWKPSIHMPRWASRITLEITSVRIERLNDISESDAMAEGIKHFSKDGKLRKYWVGDPSEEIDIPKVTWAQMPRSPVLAFQSLWESINGDGSWALNPWVWCIEFRKVEA